ncbi:MAG: SH3 domain-containing protein [Phototrophicaceae bacterium]
MTYRLFTRALSFICLVMLLAPSLLSAQPATPDPAKVLVIPANGQVVATPSGGLPSVILAPATLTPIPYVEPIFMVGERVVVNADRLNLRTAPGLVQNSQVIRQLGFGEVAYIQEVIGDASWVRVTTDTVSPQTGWVYARYLTRYVTQIETFAEGLPSQGGTGYSIIADETSRMRSSPSVFGEVVGTFPDGSVGEIIGRKSTYSWWKIKVNGVVGWVAQEYVYIPDSNAYPNVPILTE